MSNPLAINYTIEQLSMLLDKVHDSKPISFSKLRHFRNKINQLVLLRKNCNHRWIDKTFLQPYPYCQKCFMLKLELDEEDYDFNKERTR